MGKRMSVGIEDAMAVNSAATQEITVIKDEHGLLFLGDPKELKARLNDRGLASREFATKALRAGGSVVQTAAKVSSESGRWVKLTKDSAKLLEKYGKASGIQPGVVQKSNGQIIKWLRFENSSQLFSPAMATGVAGMMTQMALEQPSKRSRTTSRASTRRSETSFKIRRIRPWLTSSGWPLRWTRPRQSGTRRVH